MKKEKNKQAMILAAGIGSRLDPLTRCIPKPLAPILGKPVMEHIISLCKSHGFIDLAANIHVKADYMLEHFKNSYEKFGVNINMVYEKDLTGVAGGIRSCKQFLTDDVILVIMGDAICDADLSHLYEEHIKSGCIVTAGICEVEDTSEFGVIVTDKNNRIVSFQEKPKKEEAKSNLANTGIYLFNQSILKNMPSSNELPVYDVARHLFPELMKNNAPMQAIKINGYWADIGTLKQYQISVGDAINGKVKTQTNALKTDFGFIERGVSLPSSLKINGRAYIGENVKIGENVTFSGIVSIEKNCVIESGSYISNSVIWEGSIISKNAKIINSILANNCFVSEGTEILSNSVWAPSTQISKSSIPEKVI